MTTARRVLTGVSALILAVLPARGAPVVVFDGEQRISDGAAGLDLDFAGDAGAELNFAYFGISVNSIFAWDALVRDAGDGADARFATSTDGGGFTALTRLNEGDTVGPAIFGGSPPTSGIAAFENFYDGFSGGFFIDQQPGFIAFSIQIAGQTHYGYAQIQVDNPDTGSGDLVLLLLVYEDEPASDVSIGPDCPADLAEPFGVLDFTDVLAFLTAFAGGEPAADFADPVGVFDFTDVLGFLTAFGAGCP